MVRRRVKVRQYAKRNGTKVRSHVKRTPASNPDGDTFRLKRSLMGRKYVRLEGIDTPEKGDKGFSAAKKQLWNLMGKGKQPLTVIPKGVHRGRVVAEVKRGRKNINKEMKKRGY